MYICGGPINENLYNVVDIWDDKGKIIINNNSKFLKILKMSNWLTNVTILLPNKKAMHGFEGHGCATVFKNNKSQEYDLMDHMGIAIHTDCWKFAKKTLNHEYKYEDFNTKKLKYLKQFIMTNGNYSPIKKYWDQIFDIEKLSLNPNDWYLLYSPLKNSIESQKNAIRIKNNLQNFKPSNIVKEKIIKNRPSPSESATKFKKGDKKKGNDGNIYIIAIDKNGVKRWKKFLINKITKKSTKKLSKKLSKK